MAIDEGVFKNAWALLCERFGRTPSTPLMLAYFRTLDPQMSTAEFRQAAQVVFEEREFFPRPVDFLEALREDPSVEALKEWADVQQYIAGHVADLSPLTAEVVAIMGGKRELGQAKMESMPHLRREFMQTYAQLARAEASDRRQLAARKGRALEQGEGPRLLVEGS